MDRQLDLNENGTQRKPETRKKISKAPSIAKHGTVSFRTGVYKTPASISELEKAAE